MESSSKNFERDILPYIDTAYNVARWLTRNDEDAQDIVQEACLRAFNSFHTFRGGDARPWLLKIVRNVFYTARKKDSSRQFVEYDDELVMNECQLPQPEQIIIQESDGALVRRALVMLPTRAREMLVLREMKGMSYKEISSVMDAPAGTVMSTLSRARARLRQSLLELRNIPHNSSRRPD